MGSINRSLLFAVLYAMAGAVAAPKFVQQYRGAPEIAQGNYLSKDGWTVAKGRRMAKKRRNIMRNRNAHKGK